MRDRLIKLLQDNSYLDVLNEEHWLLAAEQLLANGVVVIDTNVVSLPNRPLISQYMGRPIDEVINLIRRSDCISVDERLPEEKETEQKFYDTESLALLDVEIQYVSDEVLVAVKDISGGYAFVTTDCTISGKWQNWENGDYTVTHWMPLPEPPKKGGAE